MTGNNDVIIHKIEITNLNSGSAHNYNYKLTDLGDIYIYAVYNATRAFSAAISDIRYIRNITEKYTPTLTISNLTPAIYYNILDEITILAHVHDTADPITTGTIEFYSKIGENTDLLGSMTPGISGTASMTYALINVGTVNIYAVYKNSAVYETIFTDPVQCLVYEPQLLMWKLCILVIIFHSQ